MAEGKYVALVFEPDVTRRTRLKTAASASSVFERVDLCNNPAEAIERLSRQHADIDVIFLSGLMPAAEQDEFIRAARKTRCGRTVALVVVQKRAGQNDSDVAAGVVRGIDGVLWEPFSVSSVVATTGVADRIKAADALARKRAAATLLYDEALYEIDEVGRSTLIGDDARYRLGMQKLRKVGGDLRTFADESLPLLIEICRTKLSTAQAQTLQVLRQPYGGVSARVQRVIDKRAGRRVD